MIRLLLVLKAISAGSSEASERTRKGWLRRKRAAPKLPLANDGTPITKEIRNEMVKAIIRSSDDSGFYPTVSGKYFMLPDGSLRLLGRQHPLFISGIFTAYKNLFHMRLPDVKTAGIARVSYIAPGRTLWQDETENELNVDAKWLTPEQKKTITEFLKTPTASVKLDVDRKLASGASESYWLVHGDDADKINKTLQRFNYGL